jgi:anti-sigma28 factor (negative regulator of flagellin synthesis)
MSNDINKLDALSIGFALASKPKTPDIQPQKTAAAAVSSQLVSLLADEEQPQDLSRVAQLKLQINTGTYSVDTDALAEKLTQAMLKTNGI